VSSYVMGLMAEGDTVGLVGVWVGRTTIVSSYVMGLMAEGNTVRSGGGVVSTKISTRGQSIPTVLIDYVIDRRG
jgi:hypothetical protein